MIVRQTTKQNPGSVSTLLWLCERSSPDDLQLVSPPGEIWLSAIVRKAYHLQRDGALPQRARAACLIHGPRSVALCIAGYGIMYVTLQHTSMVDRKLTRC